MSSKTKTKDIPKNISFSCEVSELSMGNEEINNENVETWNNVITVLDYKNKRENKFLNVSNDNNVIQVENMNKFSLSQVDDKQELSVRDDNPDITVLKEPEKSPDFITVPSLSKKKDDTRRKINKSAQEIYQERLNAKVKVVEKKFTKLARVLYKSYPIYENWLKRVEATTGNSVCKIEPPKQCPPDRAQTNRWKFVCTRKLDESSECKLGCQNTNITVNNKTIIKTVWRLGPSEDSVVNANNIFKSYPPFVMRAAKMFEDFINGFLPLKDQTNDEITHCDDQKNQWLFLLVRANSKKELLLFATGKEVSNSSMDGLKRLFDTDVGKDCNVKSLYCKSITNTSNNLTLTTTIFLLGSEALDETVGGLKIQLPPKTNFSSSTVGAELLGQAVDELLAPNDKITLVEIGCGLGLICLMIASKCEKVIGYDSLSEIEEAQITSELNKIKNAKFITGPSNEAIGRIATSMRNCESSAIVNANTKVGRDIEILTGLRKISTLRKVVMITTMAKQSIRAIMELIKPADDVHGNPFIPIRALIVDTMPNGQFFEVAILMERRIMHKLLRPFNDQSSLTKSIENFSLEKSIQTSEKSLILPKISEFDNKYDNKKINDDNKKKIDDKSISTKTAKDDIVEITKLVKNPFHHDKYNSKNCDFTANNKINQPKNLTNQTRRSRKRSRINSHRSLSPKKHRNKCIDNETTKHNDPSSTSTTNLSHIRGNNSDLRSRLSNNIRIDDDLIQTFQIQKQILENTIEELKNPVINQDDLNNIAIDKINKVQLQLSRSVWDRIAPPDNITNIDFDNTTLKGSIVHEKSNKNFVIMTPNHQFLESRNNYKKYNNIQIAEPNQVMPNERYFVLNETRDNDHYRYQSNKQQTDEKTRDWPISVGASRKPASPSWIDARLSPSKRRILSPLHRSVISSSSRPVVSAPCRKISPPSRSIMTQPRRSLLSPPHPRVLSPPSRRLMSLHRRHYSRERFYQQLSLSSSTSSFRPLCVDDMRRNVTLSRLISSPPRKQSTQRLSNSNTRQNYEITMQTSGQTLKPLIQQRRLSSSPVQLIDDWDIPSRGAIEKHDDWQKQKCPQLMLNWDTTKRIDLNNFRNDDLWINKNQADVVNDKLVSSNMFDTRWNDPVLNGKSSIDSWGVRDNESSFVKYTNNLRDDSWIESNDKSDDNRLRLESQNISRNWNQNNDREDWNDLPEDARDPWADDAVNVDKDRSQNSTQQIEWAGSLKNKQSVPPLINSNSSQQNWHQNSMVNQHLLKNSSWASNSNHNLVKKNSPGSIWVQHNTASTWRNFPQ